MEWASIGLSDMFNAGGAIVSEQLVTRGDVRSGSGAGPSDVTAAELTVSYDQGQNTTVQ